MDAAQTGEASPAQDMCQHCFCLIIGGMRDGNFVEMACIHKRDERLVTRAACRVLYIAFLVSPYSRHPLVQGEKLDYSSPRVWQRIFHWTRMPPHPIYY